MGWAIVLDARNEETSTSQDLLFELFRDSVLIAVRGRWLRRDDFEFDAGDVENEILQAILEKYPLLTDLLNEKELDSSGTLDTWAFGYKYQFLVGYRFGKYKNLKKK